MIKPQLPVRGRLFSFYRLVFRPGQNNQWQNYNKTLPQIQQLRMIITYDREFKVALIGDEAVGKSSIIKRLIDETFQQIFLKTIGVTFAHRIIDLQGEKTKLSIYDLSGQQKFHSIAPCIYSHSHALILCFDVTNQQSYENMKSYWMKQLQDHNRSGCSIFIMGNKVDQQVHKIDKEQVEQFANKHNISKVYYVSAKQNTNIEESFKDIARIISAGPQKAVNPNEQEHCKLNHQHFSIQEGKCYKN